MDEEEFYDAETAGGYCLGMWDDERMADNRHYIERKLKEAAEREYLENRPTWEEIEAQENALWEARERRRKLWESGKAHA